MNAHERAHTFVRYHPWNSGLSRYSPLKAWLREVATKEMLTEGFYAHIDKSWAEELAYAVKVLEWLGHK